jgi:hypothetical protein
MEEKFDPALARSRLMAVDLVVDDIYESAHRSQKCHPSAAGCSTSAFSPG